MKIAIWQKLYTICIITRKIICTYYLQPILEEVQVVNKLFESNDVDPTKLYKDLIGLVESISRRILNLTAKVDTLTQNIDSYLDPRPYMGYAFETKLLEYDLQSNTAIQLRQRCISFTLKLVKELRSRLPVNFSVLQNVSIFSVEEILKLVNPPIVEIAKEFGKDTQTIEKVITQWRNIVHIEWEAVSSTLDFWNAVMMYRDAANNNPFTDLCRFAMSILSLPHSNAEVERVFSQMNLVKTKLRNRLAVSTLNAILYVRFGLNRAGKCCHSYSVPDVLSAIGTKDSYSGPSSSGVVISTNEIDQEIDILFE